MYDKTIHIVTCEYLEQEIRKILEKVKWEVSVHFFPHNCEGRVDLLKELELLREENGGKGHLWLLVGGSCIGSLDIPFQAEEGVHTLCREQCSFLLGEAGSLKKHQQEGAYIVTPGWLSAWRQHIEEWGFTQKVAQEFFQEWCTSIALVDTGVNPRSTLDLKDFAQYVDRDCQVIAADVNQFALYLTQTVYEMVQGRQNAKIIESQEEKVQYAMVLDLYVRLSQGKTVQQVLQDTQNLLDMMFIPRQTYCWRAEDFDGGGWNPEGVSAKQLEDVLLDKEPSVFDEEKGSILFRLKGTNQQSWIFYIEQVMFPQYILRYVNFVISMKPVLELTLSKIQLQESERDLKEKMLAFEKARFKATLDSIGNGVIAVDAQGRIAFLNPSAERITGWSADSMLGKRLSEVFVLQHAVTGEGIPLALEEVLALGNSLSITEETVLYGEGGRKIYIEGKMSPLGKPGMEQGMVIAFQDVTEKHMERRNREMAAYTAAFAERFTSIGMLSAGLAHEINQPLQALQTKVNGILYWRQRGVEPSFENLISSMEFISKQIGRIDGLVKQLRAFAKPDHHYIEMGPVNISEVIPGALDLLSTALKSSGIKVVLKSGVAMPKILGQKNRMEEMVVHLINYSRYSLERCEKTYKEMIIEIGVKQDGQRVFLILQDNGLGITEKEKAHIFDPFFAVSGQSKEPSLGFWIIKCIVEAHKGEIEIGNSEQGGFFCRIDFPILSYQ